MLVLSLEAGLRVDPASGLSYPSLDAELFLLNERLVFSSVRDVLLVKRKSIPKRPFIQGVSVLVLTRVQDTEIFTWI